MKLKLPPCAQCCCMDCGRTKKERIECKRYYKKHPELLDPIIINIADIKIKLEKGETK